MASVRVAGIVSHKLFDGKLLKLVETIYGEKRDGTMYEFKRIWNCWFEEPQDLVVINGTMDTWAEIHSESLDAKQTSYTKSDGQSKTVIEFSLNKCQISTSKAPKSDDWLGDHKTAVEDRLAGYSGDDGLPF